MTDHYFGSIFDFNNDGHLDVIEQATAYTALFESSREGSYGSDSDPMTDTAYNRNMSIGGFDFDGERDPDDWLDEEDPDDWFDGDDL